MYPRRPTHSATPGWHFWAIFAATAVVVMFIVPRVGWMGLLLFIWLGVPLLQRVLASVSQNYAARTSAANPEAAAAATYHAPSAANAEDEKPKRRPVYAVGDDGELVEVEPEFAADKPKRGQNGRDSFV